MIFFRDDLEIIFTMGSMSESLFKSFQHCHSASSCDREDSSLTQNAILSSFSGDRTFLLGSSWFKGSHDFALPRVHRGSRPIFLLTFPRGVARVLHSGFFFRTAPFIKIIQSHVYDVDRHLQEKATLSTLTVLIFFFFPIADIKF